MSIKVTRFVNTFPPVRIRLSPYRKSPINIKEGRYFHALDLEIRFRSFGLAITVSWCS